jgi:hypothetical protein
MRPPQRHHENYLSAVIRFGLLTLVATCSLAAAATAVPASTPPFEVLRHCGTRGDGSKPQRLPPPPRVRIGPLVIWPSVRTRVEQYGHPAWAYYVKAPIILPARTKVVLAVAPEATSLVAFQARGNRFGSAVRFEACREREPAFPGSYRGTVGKYTGFPFGFVLARRSACVPLEVWIDGRAEPIRRLVPFGRRSC